MFSKRLVFEWSCWESGLGGIVIKKNSTQRKKESTDLYKPGFFTIVLVKCDSCCNVLLCQK